MSFYDLQDIISEQTPVQNEFVKQTLIPRMKEIISVSMESVKKKLKIPANHKG